MEFDGIWNAVIDTPIGKLNVVFEIATDGKAICGTARQGTDVVEFHPPGN